MPGGMLWKSKNGIGTSKQCNWQHESQQKNVLIFRKRRELASERDSTRVSAKVTMTEAVVSAVSVSKVVPPPYREQAKKELEEVRVGEGMRGCNRIVH